MIHHGGTMHIYRFGLCILVFYEDINKSRNYLKNTTIIDFYFFNQLNYFYCLDLIRVIASRENDIPECVDCKNFKKEVTSYEKCVIYPSVYHPLYA